MTAEELLRKMRGFHVEGLPGDPGDQAGMVQIYCWRCGCPRVLGDGRDAVLASDVAEWCMGHHCPGLAVT